MSETLIEIPDGPAASRYCGPLGAWCYCIVGRDPRTGEPWTATLYGVDAARISIAILANYVDRHGLPNGSVTDADWLVAAVLAARARDPG